MLRLYSGSRATAARDGFACFFVGCPAALGFAFIPFLLSAGER